MVSFNGNVNNNLFIQSGWQKPSSRKVDEKSLVNFADNKAIGEIGDKLLEQVQPNFVQASKLPEQDEKDLKEMYALAGIKNVKLPTRSQYARIEGSVQNASDNISQLLTGNNAEELYNSQQFNVLNELFGIA